MNLDLQLQGVLRYFLLPISFSKESDCIEIIKRLLKHASIDEDSYSKYLLEKYSDWKSFGNLDPVLKKLIGEILITGNSENGILYSENYFEIHEILRKNPFIDFEFSTITLSHLRLIWILGIQEKMSSAKIAQVLHSVDARLTVISWKEVRIILRNLRILPQVSIDKAKDVYRIDEVLELEYFADADINDSSYLVGQVAKNLRFEYDAELLLNKLASEKNIHIPYLQILHYQCLISDFYDHLLSVPYEFSPRGKLAKWLFGKWDDLVPTSNPILNNAKAVDVLDKNWARSKKTNEFENASILTELLKGIGEMGFAASQEFAMWIRLWLVRYIRINSNELIPIPYNLSEDRVENLLENICNHPTSTYGILEQRLVDLISSIIHPMEDWRARGLKDSVNANNISKKKLGDNDFQNSGLKEIVAYEAHGGKLNSIYYEGHLKTLARTFLLRKEELEAIADIKEWSIKVIFVAYDFEEGLANSFEIDKSMIKIEFIKFKDFLKCVDLKSNIFKEVFKSLFIDVLNNRRTPELAREKIRLMLMD